MEITKEMLYTASQAANHQQLRVMYDAMKDERDAYLAELQKANAVIIDLQRNPPKLLENHLRQVRADAVFDAVNEHGKKYGNSHFGRHLREYADSILAGKE